MENGTFEVLRILLRKENGFFLAWGRFTTHNDLGPEEYIKISGSILPTPRLREIITIEGERYEHPDYGLQLNCSRIEYPTATDLVTRMIVLQQIPSIGEKTALLLIKTLNEHLIEVAQKPDRLKVIQGIGDKKANIISVMIRRELQRLGEPVDA